MEFWEVSGAALKWYFILGHEEAESCMSEK